VAAVIVPIAFDGGSEETANAQLDTVSRECRAGHKAGAEQGCGSQENFFHLEIP
jgi:hypothetical protein